MSKCIKAVESATGSISPQPASRVSDNFGGGTQPRIAVGVAPCFGGLGSERCFYLWGANRQRQRAFAASLCACRGRMRSAAQAMRSAACRSLPKWWRCMMSIGLDAVAQIELFNLYNRMRDSAECCWSAVCKRRCISSCATTCARAWGGVGLVSGHGLGDEKNRGVVTTCRRQKGLPCRRKLPNTCCATAAATCSLNGGAGRAG